MDFDGWIGCGGGIGWNRAVWSMSVSPVRIVVNAFSPPAVWFDEGSDVTQERISGGRMTREDAIRIANETMAVLGYVDRGRGILEVRSSGQQFYSAKIITGRSFNEKIGDPHWAILYTAMFIEDDGSLRPTRREQTFVMVVRPPVTLTSIARYRRRSFVVS